MSFIPTTRDRTVDLAFNGGGVPVFVLAGGGKFVPTKLRKRNTTPCHSHKSKLGVRGPIVPIAVKLLGRSVVPDVVFYSSGMLPNHFGNAIIRKPQASDAVKRGSSSWNKVTTGL